MTERELQAMVVEAARWGGWRAYHTFDSRRSEPGFPDLVLVRGAEALFVELKSAAGRVSPAQRAWLDALGGVDRVESMVVRPDTADDLVARLTARVRVAPCDTT